ncbi:hypothetical protein [Sphingomonas sanxanigenens]|uniref:Uncharacterized protein n=1 Tax=Sphingomonas sanxanigenens DSM 19645 = NX02 TaxID=1123269 RepID=W0AAY0_9SPHN|nr:hypothetical protein [Sphingomonas sanxanigenens]AHE52830.1 hypothetical protein NX02_05455 [Sphingomonas sanxanigenens DSM 19645 = NX02]
MIDRLDGPIPAVPLTERETAAIAAKMVVMKDCDARIARLLTRLDQLADEAGLVTWRAVAVKVRAIRDAPAV